MISEFYVFSKMAKKVFTDPDIWTKKDDNGDMQYLYAFGDIDKMSKLFYVIYTDSGYDACIFDQEGQIFKKSRSFDMENFYEAKKKSNCSDSDKEFLLSKKGELIERQRKLQEEAEAQGTE